MTAQPRSKHDPPGSTAGAQVYAAITQVLRWGNRAEVRRATMGPVAGDLSPNDTWLLAAIDEHGPVRASVLAARQGVDKSTITPQVRGLESRGLVGREPDPDDRRAVLLTLTARGRQVRRRAAASGAAVIDQVLADWSDTDRRALAELMARFADQLEHSTGRGQVPSG